MKLFDPLKINSMTVKNRIVMPAMGTDFAQEGSHAVGERFKAYMEARAKGGTGLLIHEYVAVHPGGLASPRQLGLWDDKFIPGLREVTDMAHEYGAKIAVQLHHAGRETSSAVCGAQPIAPSALPSPRRKEQPREMTIAEIQEVVEYFAEAATRAKQAGFDAVEIHGAHGYLVSQFMSGYANKRTDEYGNSLEGYMRFPLEIVKAVRQAVGPDYPVGFRYSAEEHVADGRTLDTAVQAAKMLEQAGVDWLHVSVGVIESAYYIITPMSLPRGWNVGAAEAVKQAVSIPVIAVGRTHEPALAEEVIASGKADMVALGRALLVDPEFPNKAREGRSAEILKCIGCVQGCVEEPVACTQNPELGYEKELRITPATAQKKVLVVGGGPAGLEAARVAALRGHKVTLVEACEELGGQIRFACLPPTKQDIYGAVDSRIAVMDQLGVTVLTNTKADKEFILNFAPDAVIIATGAIPASLDLPGSDNTPVVGALEVLSGEAATGDKVVVVGGGMVGLETAELLATKNKAVVVVEMGEQAGTDVPWSTGIFMRERMAGQSVEVKTSTKALEVKPSGLLVDGPDGQAILPADTVVIAAGSRSLDVLNKELSPLFATYMIGDAVSPRKLREAIAEAAKVAREI